MLDTALRPFHATHAYPMTDFVSPQDIADVCAGLSEAWQFLAGQSRDFAFVPAERCLPSIPEFCYCLSLDVAELQRKGGVVLMMQRPEALDAAGHMFGLDAGALQDADLQDACAEVCNVFSDCIALHLAGNADVHMGLPCRTDQSQYDALITTATVVGVYQDVTPHPQLHVVVYYFSSPPH